MYWRLERQFGSVNRITSTPSFVWLHCRGEAREYSRANHIGKVQSQFLRLGGIDQEVRSISSICFQ